MTLSIEMDYPSPDVRVIIDKSLHQVIYNPRAREIRCSTLPLHLGRRGQVDGEPPGGDATPDFRPGAASKTLPAGERVTDAEFLAAVWSALTPLPLPRGLPANARLLYTLDASDGRLISGFGDEVREHCRVCGKGYKARPALAAHLERVHGWRRDQRQGLRPPAAPSEGCAPHHPALFHAPGGLAAQRTASGVSCPR